jgi:hypothetical protein
MKNPARSTINQPDFRTFSSAKPNVVYYANVPIVIALISILILLAKLYTSGMMGV